MKPNLAPGPSLPPNCFASKSLGGSIVPAVLVEFPTNQLWLKPPAIKQIYQKQDAQKEPQSLFVDIFGRHPSLLSVPLFLGESQKGSPLPLGLRSRIFRLAPCSGLISPLGQHKAKQALPWLTLKGEQTFKFEQSSGDFPLNHKKQKCKMFPNNNHVTSQCSQNQTGPEALQILLLQLKIAWVAKAGPTLNIGGFHPLNSWARAYSGGSMRYDREVVSKPGDKPTKAVAYKSPFTGLFHQVCHHLPDVPSRSALQATRIHSISQQKLPLQIGVSKIELRLWLPCKTPKRRNPAKKTAHPLKTPLFR